MVAEVVAMGIQRKVGWLALSVIFLSLGAACERVNTLVGPNRQRGRVAYQIFNNVRSQLFVLQSDDRENPIRLTTTLSDDVFPRWSPDGKTIAFLSDREGVPGLFRLYQMNDDGTSVRELFDPVADPEGDLEFSWAPDGRHIALINSVSGVRTDRRQLYILDTRTLARQRVLTALPNRYAPDWAPDGNTIALVSLNSGTNVSTLQLLSYPELELRTADLGGLQANFPRWAPDSRHLAFLAIPAGGALDEFQVFVADAMTFETRQLTAIEGGIQQPGPVTWSPDSQRILFAAPGDYVFIESFRDLYSVRLDGTDLTRFTKNNNDESSPDWTFVD